MEDEESQSQLIPEVRCPHIAGDFAESKQSDWARTPRARCPACWDGGIYMCTRCGAVGCGYASATAVGRGHAHLHHQRTGHPTAAMIGARNPFVWCFLCQAVVTGGIAESIVDEAARLAYRVYGTPPRPIDFAVGAALRGSKVPKSGGTTPAAGFERVDVVGLVGVGSHVVDATGASEVTISGCSASALAIIVGRTSPHVGISNCSGISVAIEGDAGSVSVDGSKTVSLKLGRIGAVVSVAPDSRDVGLTAPGTPIAVPLHQLTFAIPSGEYVTTFLGDERRMAGTYPARYPTPGVYVISPPDRIVGADDIPLPPRPPEIGPVVARTPQSSRGEPELELTEERTPVPKGKSRAGATVAVVACEDVGGRDRAIPGLPFPGVKELHASLKRLLDSDSESKVITVETNGALLAAGVPLASLSELRGTRFAALCLVCGFAIGTRVDVAATRSKDLGAIRDAFDPRQDRHDPRYLPSKPVSDAWKAAHRISTPCAFCDGPLYDLLFSEDEAMMRGAEMSPMYSGAAAAVGSSDSALLICGGRCDELALSLLGAVDKVYVLGDGPDSIGRSTIAIPGDPTDAIESMIGGR